MMRPISRRTLLRGAGGVAVALPFLDAMRPRTARAAAAPKRFLFWFTANGTIHYAWNCAPSGYDFPAPPVGMSGAPPLPPVPTKETEFKLNRILAPLERHKQDLIVIQNVDLSGRGYGHEESTVRQLVGREYAHSKGGYTNAAGGISLDQELAAKIGADCKFPSLQLGVKVGANSKKNEGAVSFAANGDPLVPQENPYEVFRLVFADLTGADRPDAAKIQAARRSVLDSILDNAALLQKKLGAGDRQKLDQHLTSIREIEAKLATQAAPGGRCKVPQLGADVLDWKKNDNVPLVGKIQMDLMVAALACDLTRVITFMFARAWGGGRSHTWIPGAAGDWHGVSHQGDKGDSAGWEKMVKINTWYHEQLATLVDRMKSVQEDDGRTLLDNTVIFVSNEYGNGVLGDSHHHKKMPFLLLGRCGGAFKTGRHLRYPDKTLHNGILIAIANAMGLPGKTFGDPAFGNGPLPGLLG